MDFLSIKLMLDRVQVYVQGAANPLIERAILDAAREFCIATEVHQAPSYPLPLVPKVVRYEFDAWYEHLVVERAYNLTQRGTVNKGIFTLDDPGATGTVQATLVLAPAHDAKVLWDRLINDHHQALESGALAKLYRQRGADFFNPDLAREERGRFHDEIHNAMSNGRQRVRMRGKHWAA